MENQKELLEKIVLYLRENQRVLKELAEKLKENDRNPTTQLTKVGDRLLKSIEEIAQIPNPPHPQYLG